MELTMVKAHVKRGMMPRSMVGSESFCRALWRCDNGRGESVGFEGRCWKRSVDAVVVEMGGNRRVSRPPTGRLSAMIAMVNKAHVQLIAGERKTTWKAKRRRVPARE